MLLNYFVRKLFKKQKNGTEKSLEKNFVRKSIVIKIEIRETFNLKAEVKQIKVFVHSIIRKKEFKTH